MSNPGTGNHKALASDLWDGFIQSTKTIGRGDGLTLWTPGPETDRARWIWPTAWALRVVERGPR